ncbi:MAG: sulfide/dihydroorotate dehydrogenase-like FAD/NAD-binding protein [Candidatus Eremiobacteraeota bacterium]|nr:sulfide/dihydroorotate dehydrogenase-like FAD/NAD-binding protein [Candidatus Eremiobacteraeota bacterium]
MGYKILHKEVLGPNTKLIEVKAPLITSRARAGQFIILRANEKGERIPLTLSDWNMDKGTITLVFQEVGKTTFYLGSLGPGDEIEDVVGPLGKPSEIKNYGTVIMVGGGLGIAPIYPIARDLKNAGNKILTIIGARTGDLLFWKDRFEEISDDFKICTDDGSCGIKGVVTVPLEDILKKIKPDLVFAIGPAIMMKFVAKTTRPYGIKTIVSLNAIMVDGTGMCGACRVEVGGKTLFSCIDGPEFDAHKVDFELLMKRLNTYCKEEKTAMEFYKAHAAGK